MAVEELAADAVEHPGATRGDASLGELNEEPREELADIDARRGFGEFREKFGREIDGVVDGLRERDGRGLGQASFQKVPGAKSGVRGTKATPAAVGIAVLATRRRGSVRLGAEYERSFDSLRSLRTRILVGCSVDGELSG